MVKSWSRFWSRSQGRIAGRGGRPIESESTRNAALAAKPKRDRGWTFAAFRAWRHRAHPGSSYQIAPAVWRPERYAEFCREPDARRRALKNWEPRFTGLACSDHAVFLVEVVGELTAEIVGKLLYCADLFRRDPDYDQHRHKRMYLVILAREATTSLRDFARRCHIRVHVWSADTEVDMTDAR
jgi:hypothetical protein